MLIIRDLPDMMSASEGGGGSWKCGRSKGGFVNFILQISSKCGQGGRGKSKNFADVIYGSSRMRSAEKAKLVPPESERPFSCCPEQTAD